MFYACLATLSCVGLGISGIIISLIDIDRYNFGLYLALLSVVGTTVSVAFWIISPTMCANPRWVQWMLNKYGYKLDPVREFARSQYRKHRKRFWDDEESATLKPKIDRKQRRRQTKGHKPSTSSRLATTSSLVASLAIEAPETSHHRIEIEEEQEEEEAHSV